MRKSWLSFFMMFMVLMFSCLGCAGWLAGRYGTMAPDAQAAKAFESFQINPDLSYYVSGSDEYPNALLGLNKKYALDSTLWKRIDPTPQRFRELVLQMQARARQIGQSQFGFAIFDDKGHQIGVWYSILSARAPVLMKENQHVEIYTPDIDTYIKHESRD